MAIALSHNCKTMEAATARAFCRKFIVAAARAHKGSLPLTQSHMELTENVALSDVKLSEDGSGIIVRYYELEGK
jgi:alpha-mannosidase